jgi:hypothetical protein
VGGVASVEAFNTAFHPECCLLVGGDGIPVVDFISKPIRNWILG